MNYPTEAPAAQGLGASLHEWAHWQALGLTPDLLPVVSDLATPISPASKLTQLDGKAPSRIDAGGLATGVAGWATKRASAQDVRRWANEARHGIGLVGRQVKAFDIDIDDAKAAGAVRDLIELLVGPLPARTRSNSGKCLLIFRMAEPMTKVRIQTPCGVVELLGDRQQFLIAGTHKTGVRYEWEGGLPDEIPALTPDEVEGVRAALLRRFGIPGGASADRAPIATQRPRTAADMDDADAAWLFANGWVTGEHVDGKLDVRCPWQDQHSEGAGPTSSTTYMPAGVGGEVLAGWRCLHAHCAGRTIFDFRRAIGLDDPADDFEPLTEAQAAEAADAAIRHAQRAPAVVLDDFFAYGPDHKFIYRPTRAMWPAASVDGMVNPWPQVGGKPMAPSRWLDRNRAVQQMTWLPGKPELIKDLVVLESGFASRPGARVFNRYVPPAPFVGDAGQAGLWLDHLKLIYPDDWPHLLNWFAHRVQRPDEKVNHALVLGGTQGIGKDSVLVPVKAGVGACNVQDIAPGALLGAFNGFVASVLLVVSEARDLGDSDRFKLYEHCKTLTAAPPDVLRVNEKHLREYYVPNLVGVIFTTNHRTSGLYLPAEDRRHYVAWSEVQPAALDPDYFKRLYAWYDAGGVGHVLAYLHGFDLQGFNPKAEPVKTDAFWALVHAGESPEANELRDAIKACGSPAAVTVRMVRDAAMRAGLDDLAAQLHDPKGRARLPHMFERVGYVTVRNPDSKADGRFGKETVYALSALTTSERIAAARKVQFTARSPKTAEGTNAQDFA
jgi:hypothetical protein